MIQRSLASFLGLLIVAFIAIAQTPSAPSQLAIIASQGGGSADTTPDAFSFTDQSNVELSTTITSTGVTIQGIAAAVSCSATGGTIDVAADADFQSSRDVTNGQSIRARHTSSASNSTAVNTSVDCGGVSDTFTSTTEAAEESLSSACDDGNTSDDIYVRDGGTGDGDAWNDALDQVPTTIARGSDIYVADGTYNSVTLDDAASGTTVSNICKATADFHGTDTGWLSSYGDGQATFGRFDIDTDYWHIDGVTGGGPNDFDCANCGFKIVGTTGRRIDFGANVNDVTIEHFEATNTNNTPDGGVSFGAGVYTANNVDNISVSDCKIHHIYGPIFHTANGSLDNWTVQRCKLGDNTGDSQGHSEIWSMQGNDQMTIRWNYIFQWRSTGGIMCINGTEGGTGDENICEDVQIYGNIFDQDGTTASWMIAAIQDSTNDEYARRWKIHNNSFIGVNSSASGVNAISLATTGESNNEAYNNIWYGHTDTLSFSGVTHDYNWYSGATAHSETNGTAGGATDPFADSANGDYSLASALAGTSLSSPYNEDMLGETRGADGTFDRGYLEYVDE